MTDEPWHQNVSLPALLRHARSTYGRAMRAALAAAGCDDIPANGLYIIGGLALEPGGVPIRQLVEELGITKQGAGQLVDTLVMRGYLQRTPDERDRRQLIVSLTERGEAAAATQLAARRAVDAALLAAVGDADLEVTRRALAALIDLGRDQRAGGTRIADTQPTRSETDSATDKKRFQRRALDDAEFLDCSMARARFDDVNLSGATFSNINLKQARFRDINMAGVSIDDADITGLTIFGHDIQALIKAA